MNFQDNKFPIMLGTITGVVAAGLIFWGMSSSKKYKTAKEDYQTKVSEIEKLSKIVPTPDDESAKAKKKNVTAYKADVESLQKDFDTYRAIELKNVDVDVFTDKLLETKNALLAEFANAETQLPDNFFAGIERYTTQPPDKKATGVLLYQLGAFAEMFDMLAKSKPTELVNVYRPEIEEEKGEKFDSEGKVYRVHPIELTFIGPESTLREFLSRLDGSEEHYYVVRSLRISNERSTPPNAQDASFEQLKKEDESDNPFEAGGFNFFDDEEEGEEGDGEGEGEEEETEEEEAEEPAPEPADSGEILKQVLGDEKIQVFMRIDVLQFLKAAELPNR